MTMTNPALFLAGIMLAAVTQASAHNATRLNDTHTADVECPIPGNEEEFNGGCSLFGEFNRFCPSNEGCYSNGNAAGCDGGACPPYGLYLTRAPTVAPPPSFAPTAGPPTIAPPLCPVAGSGENGGCSLHGEFNRFCAYNGGCYSDETAEECVCGLCPRYSDVPTPAPPPTTSPDCPLPGSGENGGCSLDGEFNRFCPCNGGCYSEENADGCFLGTCPPYDPLGFKLEDQA